jgi:hypothetical protein
VSDQSYLGDGIPDSEANQKLLHRWYLSEDSDPFVDQEGSADGTNNGTAQVTGNEYVDGAARSGDGVDDYISYTTLGSFGSTYGASHAVALTVETATTGTGQTVFGCNDGTPGQLFHLYRINKGQTGAVGFLIQDDNGNRLEGSTGDIGINDGSRHRVVFNVVDTSNNNVEIWVDGSEQTVSFSSQGSPSSFSDYSDPFYSHAQNQQGAADNHYEGVLDDPSVFDDSLTSSEISSYSLP